MSRTPLAGVEHAPARRRAARGAAAAALGLVALGLTGCSTSDIPNQLQIPDPASEQGERIFHLWQGSWVAAWAVGAVVLGLIIWAALAYRRRSQDLPAQTTYNIPIEILYTVVPFFMIGVMFFFTARDESKLVALSDSPDHTVNVVGFRWNWTFNYVDENVYDVGTPTDVPTLYLPEGESVRFKLTSPDVIHSFWVPQFLFKMDVIPGQTNEFEITPTKQGTFAGKCAELCGVDHSRMLFWVKVVSPDEYDDHVADLKAKGQVGLLETGRTTESVTGEEMGRTTIGGDS